MHDTAAAALSPFDIAALLVVAAAVFGYINHHYIRLPHVIGLTIMGALAAIVLTVLNALVPSITLDDTVSRLLEQLNFTDTLLQGMLSFLLFAGALHVDLKRLSADWLPVLLLSTVGVVTSTVLVGGATWGLGLLLGVEIAPIWYFVFGALISPTDPVSVLGVLKTEDVPLSLQSAVAGESLFNDGVGIVVFTILLGAAVTGADFSIAEGARLFVIEAGGGLAVGVAIGWLGFRGMRSMDEYTLEVLISLAVVMGGYALCSQLHLSGPIAMAVAGLLIGNFGAHYAMSDETLDYVNKFWELVDELLNSVLFLLIGLELIALVPGGTEFIFGLAAIPIVLAARGISVFGAIKVMPSARLDTPGSGRVLWWGGLRGGISVALALSLPAGDTRDILLAATFGAVLFSVLIQRATLGKLIDGLQADDSPCMQEEPTARTSGAD
ncbi:sodium:proton antiporter [Citromicrobium bathyomarinum]|uniref:cation:proton antiporter n=1 Tax=Citromicrobium sp. WPS32 TaxID=1634517 RepID=UPI0006C936C0|nr:sodium:proton antiporter [Citromicrobium sp. WPS32]KPM15678.1 sodium:proton antiporter [Citromicrobium sp. WPS32]MAY77863.1 sodium:proton antiporter [Citromicrobium sp.]|tara:strand:+ start:2927 stop:4243 length:1317 start_codon:yes stop_codon:yes gene_type:complete